MNHLDLFSGIGGFALATEMVWDDVEHTFCEIDPFCQEVLKKHWPNSYIHGDIRTLTADTYLKRHLHGGSEEQSAEGRHEAQREPLAGAGTPALPEIDLLTGGFPCQPFSQAGRRRGTEDDRHLWPEMLRVIREFHPRWVIGENVGGFVTWSGGLVLEQVHADLEGEGYEVQAFIIPAVALNAPHRRDRVWIVAHATGERRDNRLDNREERHVPANEGTSEESKSERKGRKRGTGEVGTDASDTRREHGGKGNGEGVETHKEERASRNSDSERRSKNVANAEGFNVGRRGSNPAGHDRKLSRKRSGEGRTGWDENWLEVATALCRVDDGIPRRLDRNPRLKALGNAIVPQVAAEVMRAIKETENAVK